MSPKKHKLSVSIDENYCLIGISSDEPDYKLCWLINDSKATSFMKTDDLCLYNKKISADQTFSMFIFEDETAMLTYRIIKNNGDRGFFLPELSKLDYILHIQGDLIQDDLDHFMASLNNLKAIRMCVPIDILKLKDRDRLHLW